MIFSVIFPVRKVIRTAIVFLFFFNGVSPICGESLWLGILMKEETSLPKSYQEQGYGYGLKIEKVLPQSGAVEAGLITGDYIVGLNQKALQSKAQIKEQIQKAHGGEALHLRIGREGKIISAEVKLKGRPDDISDLVGSALGSRKPYLPEVYANSSNVQSQPKLILLDFWATWCQPCRMTSKILDQVYSEYSKRGVEIIGISNENLALLKDFQKEHKVSYPLGNDASGRISKSYGVSQIPTLFLLDSDGYILQVWKGVPDSKALKAQLERQLY